MAKKIDAETAKTLKNLGITAKTEEEARKKLVAALEKEGIEGMEDESLAALIDMADGFLNDGEEDTEDEVEEETADETEADSDEEMDELADEVEAEDETEDEVEDETEDEEPEVEKKPAKPVKKATPAKKEKTTKEKAEKPAKTTKKQATSSRGQKLDPQNSEDDRKVFDEIKDMFGKDYVFDYVKSNGATVKYLGKNGKRGVILIENLTRHNNGTVTCNLYLLTMAKQTEVLDEMGIDYTLCWTNAPVMKNITLEEVKEILEKIFEIITSAVIKIDKRLGSNRKKMEENLQKSVKKPVKANKVIEPEEVDDEEEEEVGEEKPVKSAKKATSAKKVAKKAKK